MTLVLEISDSVAEKLVGFAYAEGEEPNAYATAALTTYIMEKPAPAYNFTEEQRAAARLELQSLRPHDPEAVFRKFGLTWSNRTSEEIAADAEKALAAMSSKDREYLTRQGLI